MLTNKSRNSIEKEIYKLCKLEEKLIKREGRDKGLINVMNYCKMILRSYLNADAKDHKLQIEIKVLDD